MGNHEPEQGRDDGMIWDISRSNSGPRFFHGLKLENGFA
jgi:hypothetical protein